jgi:uncharacterized protein
VSEENVEIVRRIFGAWEKGSPTDSGLIAEDVEWVNDARAVEPGIRRGIDAFEDAAAKVSGAFAGARVELERLVDAGDKVVAIGVLQGTGRGSGLEVGRRQGYVWTIRDGKAVRFEWFNDAHAALAAAGVEN